MSNTSPNPWQNRRCYNNYSHFEQTPQGRVHYLENGYTQKYFALSADFEPLFAVQNIMEANAFRDIRYLKDGLFTVRTARFSGLMRMDGSWLICIIAQNQD
jgi:hypothetical protein